VPFICSLIFLVRQCPFSFFSLRLLSFLGCFIDDPALYDLVSITLSRSPVRRVLRSLFPDDVVRVLEVPDHSDSPGLIPAGLKNLRAKDGTAWAFSICFTHRTLPRFHQVGINRTSCPARSSLPLCMLPYRQTLRCTAAPHGLSLFWLFSCG